MFALRSLLFRDCSNSHTLKVGPVYRQGPRLESGPRFTIHGELAKQGRSRLASLWSEFHNIRVSCGLIAPDWFALRRDRFGHGLRVEADALEHRRGASASRLRTLAVAALRLAATATIIHEAGVATRSCRCCAGWTEHCAQRTPPGLAPYRGSAGSSFSAIPATNGGPRPHFDCRVAKAPCEWNFADYCLM